MKHCPKCNSAQLIRNPSSYTCGGCGNIIWDMAECQKKIAKFNSHRDLTGELMIDNNPPLPELAPSIVLLAKWEAVKYKPPSKEMVSQLQLNAIQHGWNACARCGSTNLFSCCVTYEFLGDAILKGELKLKT